MPASTACSSCFGSSKYTGAAGLLPCVSISAVGSESPLIQALVPESETAGKSQVALRAGTKLCEEGVRKARLNKPKGSAPTGISTVASMSESSSIDIKSHIAIEEIEESDIDFTCLVSAVDQQNEDDSPLLFPYLDVSTFSVGSALPKEEEKGLHSIAEAEPTPTPTRDRNRQGNDTITAIYNLTKSFSSNGRNFSW